MSTTKRDSGFRVTFLCASSVPRCLCGEMGFSSREGEERALKARMSSLAAGAGLLAALSLAVCLLPLGVPARGQSGSRSNSQANTRPLREVLENLSRSAGVVALADSTLQGEHVLPPSGAATSENVEQQIKALARALPAGTTWVRLYLPAPADGRWNADVVSQYALAQARLTGRRIGGETSPGTIEILGQQVPEEKGREYVAGLHLKRVYLLTNPRLQAMGGAVAMQNQLQQFQSMDATARAQFMMQLHDQMEQQTFPLRTIEQTLWDSLPDDQ